MINRRTAIREFLLISAGATLIPSCLQENSKSGILLKNFQVGTRQERLLAELAETLIPATTTPGAKDISAHLFILKMLDDCYSKNDQQKFMRGLQQLDDAAQASMGNSFVGSTATGRASLLTRIEGKKEDGNDLNFFYTTMKKLTILAYTTSRFFLTKIQVYELVPARFHGCVPVKNETKALS
jgi:hypothetical protein